MLNMAVGESLMILIFILPFIIALIDILRHEFNGNNKLIWLIVVIFVPLLGPIIYFIIGRKQKIIAK